MEKLKINETWIKNSGQMDNRAIIKKDMTTRDKAIHGHKKKLKDISTPIRVPLC